MQGGDIGSNITPLQYCFSDFTLGNVQIDFYYVISARLYNNAYYEGGHAKP